MDIIITKTINISDLIVRTVQDLSRTTSLEHYTHSIVIIVVITNTINMFRVIALIVLIAQDLLREAFLEQCPKIRIN
jgi:hypothetical protein